MNKIQSLKKLCVSCWTTYIYRLSIPFFVTYLYISSIYPYWLRLFDGPGHPVLCPHMFLHYSMAKANEQVGLHKLILMFGDGRAMLIVLLSIFHTAPKKYFIS